MVYFFFLCGKSEEGKKQAKRDSSCSVCRYVVSLEQEI